MAKLEEISELLVSEIRDFEETVKRLEEIQKKKIQLDISELQRTFNKHEKYLSITISNFEKQLKRIEGIFEKANIYPKWVVVIFVISLILNGIVAMMVLSH